MHVPDAQLMLLFDDGSSLAMAPEAPAAPPVPQTVIAKAVADAVAVPETYFSLEGLIPGDGRIGSDAQKIAYNLDAIALVQKLSTSGREATPEDKALLAKYSGWGGLSAVFEEKKSHAALTKLTALAPEKWVKAARESILTAYYTPPTVIKAIWRILGEMGFQGGNILDPSAGIGHFTGFMPQSVRQKSRVVMVEPDHASAAIASALYSSKTCRVVEAGIEDVPLRKGSFDLVVSNIPFGNFRVYDPEFDHMKLSIHDYFFAKALALVRPGGLVAFITSTFTLDGEKKTFREMLAGKADLALAMRLPSGTFRHIANTDVTTDLLIFRRKDGTDYSSRALNFSGKAMGSMLMAPECHWQRGYVVNQVFCQQPHLHLGGARQGGSRYGEVQWDVCLKDGESLEDAITAALFKHELGEEGKSGIHGWYTPVSQDAGSDGMHFSQAVASGYFIDDFDRVCYLAPDGSADQVSHKGATYERLYSMVRLRDAVAELIESDVAGLDSTDQRRGLNAMYDGFTKRFDNLMAPVNRRLFSLDSKAPLLWSLERFDEVKDCWVKTDIFNRCTVSKATLADKAETLADAVALALNRVGRLDAGEVARLLGKSSEEVTNLLLEEDLAFEDPESGELVEKTAYLSGNVREKHKSAKLAARENPRFTRNETALASVVPVDIPMEQISIRLGAPWIRADEILQFAAELVEMDADQITVSHSPRLAAWTAKAAARYAARNNVLVNSTYGTARRDFFSILECLLNQVMPQVKDEVETDDGKKRQVVNPEETAAARDKAEQIQAAFEKWVRNDPARSAELERRYNDLYNSVVNRSYDGSHLVIPGLNPTITLRAAQKDSIWRGIVSGNVLMALAVGGGKTLIQIVLAQELKRLGISKKPTLVVPNHMLEAFAGEYIRAFPRARVLAATKEDLEGDRRRVLLMRIATGDWDAVILTHSSFGKLEISKEAAAAFRDDALTEIESAIRETTCGDGGDSRRDLERIKKGIEAKLDRLTDRGRQDEGLLTFDQLGIDYLLVDEADLFKNLWFFTRKTRVAGINNTASIRAFDMFLKSREVFKKRGSANSGLVFSTATPIANTVCEMYIMQLYLQEELLREHKLDRFDAWAANFGREVTSIEVSPEGGGYRMHTRFCRFENVPELMRLFREVAEIRTKKMLNLPEPELAGGKHTIVSAKATDALREFVATLVKRAEAIRNGEVTPDVDNMLVVTSDGRKAALDLRCKLDFAEDFPGSKINLAAEKIFRHWEEGADERLTQLVFCDMSTPSADRFSAYNDLRAKLIAKGVPPEEIAFAQDYTGSDRAKAELHRKVRTGKVRIAMGSTELMGFGTNVQDLLVAEHHLDAPWRPRDVEQRDGRIIRQGNKNQVVYIYRYVTEESFDAYMWQTLETKAGFIAQVMENEGDVRSIEDVTSQSLTYAEVKAIASGNPLVIQKAGVDAEVAKLGLLKRAYQDNQHRLRRDLRSLQDDLSYSTTFLSGLKQDLEAAEADLNGLQSAAVEGRPERPMASEELGEDLMKRWAWIRAVDEKAKSWDRQKHAVLRAGRFMVQTEPRFGSPTHGTLTGPSGRGVAVNLEVGKERVAAQLGSGYLLTCFKGRIAQYEESVARLPYQIDALRKQAEAPFEYEARYEQALAKQLEIDAALGLTSNEAGTEGIDDKEEVAAE
jgi:N12 class adenine-specific DNA methylase